MFRVITVNVRGLANEEKRRSIFNYHRQNADILILQETHSSKECETVWQNEWGSKILFSHGTTAARGVAVCISKAFTSLISRTYTENDGRLVIFDIEENNEFVSIVAIYAPNRDTPEFFRGVRELMRDRREHKIIIGDFNLVLNVELDRENTYNNNNNSKEEVEYIMEEFCLRDLWRLRNEEKREFSWKKKGSYPSKASRIDLALVSGGLDQNVLLIQYLSSIMTDHRAIYMVVDLKLYERGGGYWKFNNTLLKEKKFIQKINMEIDNTINSCQQKTAMKTWEILKKRIKRVTVEYSRMKVKEDNIIISCLSEKVNEYEANLPLTKEEDELLEKTKVELEEKILEKTRGVMFRSKVKWYEEGERNTKYFYSLEKAKYNAKTCYKIIDDKQRELSVPQEILHEQKRFYEELYSVDSYVNFTMSKEQELFVPNEVKENQEIQITIEDLEKAIKTMNNNKTPGKDGLPIDFYKVFWTRIKRVFYDMMIEVYEEECLHVTARQGVLNLIPKVNKDTRFIKNLRPITLLNTDYKIIEKAVANKMIPALEHIIAKDQRGFMKDRKISVNIRKMLDIIHQAKVEDLEAVVLSLDFVKCFDKCSFLILHGSLEYFKFGTIVKEWTKILYRDFSVQIQNNGYFSDDIKIRKGVHQGGCCSSVYFLVIAEILAISLRKNEEIEGITLHDIKNLLSQFADDMDVFSLCLEKSIKAIYNELECFRLQSGFTVSYEKTTLYRIGSLRHASAQMYNISEFAWSNKDINVLGITIAHEEIVQKNYVPIIEKAKNVLNSWQHRGLTLMGKVQVVNTLVASLFVYKMMVLPCIPQYVVKWMENVIRKFLWNGKKAKIAYRILQNPKKEGGLNLINLSNKDKALKATWPKILYQEQEYAQLVYGQMRMLVLGSNRLEM